MSALVIASSGAAFAQETASSPSQAPAPDAAKAKEPAPEPSGALGLLFQGWVAGTSDSRFSGGATTPKFEPAGREGQLWTFRMRRLEISYNGKIGPIVKYRWMIDPATNVQGGPLKIEGDQGKETVTVKDVLQDAYLSFDHCRHELRLGQFKIPLTMEGYGSSAKLDFAERAIMTRTFSDARDIGLMLLSQGIPFVEYQVAITNGNGKNVADNSTQKNGLARLVLKPVKGLAIGGSGQLGEIYSKGKGNYLARHRFGAEGVFEIRGLKLTAEYMTGIDGQYDSTNNVEHENRPAGWYGSLGYKLGLDFGSLEAVARFEDWQSDRSSTVAECRPASGTTPAGAKAGTNQCQKDQVVSAGINVVPSAFGRVRFQLTYNYDRDRVQDKAANELFLVTQLVL